MWVVTTEFSAQTWIDDKGWEFHYPMDAQWTSEESVCIDPLARAIELPGYENKGPDDALFSGRAKCLDEPTEPCDEKAAYDKLVGPG